MRGKLKSKLLQNGVLLFDKRIIFSLLYRLSQALVGIITVLVIVRWFKPVEQGYYYTFGSLLALQTIFEMGLSFVILQFTGHEFADLYWDQSGKIAGPLEKLKEFEAFFAKCIKIYSLIAFAAFFIIWTAGIFFFSQKPNAFNIEWQIPWVLLCFATMVNIFLTPFFAVIEGSGLIVKINQFRAIQNTAGAIVMWLAMIAGFHLYSIAIDLLVCAIISIAWLIYCYPDLFRKITTGFYLTKHSISLADNKWVHEIWPMQWRIAISWIAGYFLNQLYIPIIFYYHDPVSAGKLGMSLSVCNMLSLFAITFMTAHNPEMCQLIAKKEWKALYDLFNRVFFQSLALTVFAALCVYIALLLPFLSFITHRFISPTQMLFLLLGVIFNYIIGSIAQLLRSFKQEPFVWVSLIGALLNAFLAWWLGMLYSINGIVAVFMLLNMFYGLPTAWWLWQRHTRHLWATFKEENKEVNSTCV